MKLNKSKKNISISLKDWKSIGSKAGWIKTAATKKKDALKQYSKELDFLTDLIEYLSSRKNGANFINELTRQYFEYIDEKFNLESYKIEFVPLKYSDEDWKKEEKRSFVESVSKFAMALLQDPGITNKQISDAIKQRFQKLRYSQLNIEALPKDYFDWADQNKRIQEPAGISEKSVSEEEEEDKTDPLANDLDFAKRQKDLLKKTIRDTTGNTSISKQVNNEAKIVESICEEEKTKADGKLFVNLVGIRLLEYVDSRYKDEDFVSKFIPSNLKATGLQKERKEIFEQVIEPTMAEVDSVIQSMNSSPNLSVENEEDDDVGETETGQILPEENDENDENVSSIIPEVEEEETLNDKLQKNLIRRYKDVRHRQLASMLR